MADIKNLFVTKLLIRQLKYLEQKVLDYFCHKFFM